MLVGMNTELKKRIIESKKPQIAMAREIGIPESHLSKIVNGWINPKADLKERLAHALNCEVKDIFDAVSD